MLDVGYSAGKIGLDVIVSVKAFSLLGASMIWNDHWLGAPYSWQLLTQICLALSALIIRSTEHRKPIEQLFYSLQNLQSQDDSNVAVLEMLTVLPEEIVENQNIDCNISSDRRCQYGQEVYELSLLLWHFKYLSFPSLPFSYNSLQ